MRRPAVAGTFYPAGATELAAAVDDFLSHAPRAGAVPKAIIAPHAGYVFSGQGAAIAWARFAPARERIRRVLLIGPAHRVRVDGLAHPDALALDTPLGEIRVDVSALEAIGVEASAEAHAQEHSLEVHLPFLQRVLPEASVVPLVAGGASPGEIANVLDSLWGGEETVIAISSDLSHYLSDEEARRLDARTAASIVAFESVHGDSACGALPIAGLLRAARHRRMTAEILDLRNSSDSKAGSRDRVVGYGAFAFHERSGA